MTFVHIPKPEYFEMEEVYLITNYVVRLLGKEIYNAVGNVGIYF